ncbi:MAG: hypothetical protein LBL35_06840 [Clostridiales bacterium]|nr:hypothetical protein [Clostridiales bacterium]
MKKRLFATVICTFLTVVLTAGCGTTNDEGQSSDDTPVEQDGGSTDDITPPVDEDTAPEGGFDLPEIPPTDGTAGDEIVGEEVDGEGIDVTDLTGGAEIDGAVDDTAGLTVDVVGEPVEPTAEGIVDPALLEGAETDGAAAAIQ